MHSLVGALAEKKRLTLTLDVEDSLPAITADEPKFKQIVYHLLSNAIKFTAEGGRVRLGARRTSDGLEVAVADTGAGIAPDVRERLFAPFERADDSSARAEQGPGLGLALTRKLVELHGGRIRVESEVGRGSTFTFLLPFAPTPRRRPSPTPGVVAGTPGRPCVLVVEDDPQLSELLADYLTPAGNRGDAGRDQRLAGEARQPRRAPRSHAAGRPGTRVAARDARRELGDRHGRRDDPRHRGPAAQPGARDGSPASGGVHGAAGAVRRGGAASGPGGTARPHPDGHPPAGDGRARCGPVAQARSAHPGHPRRGSDGPGDEGRRRPGARRRLRRLHHEADRHAHLRPHGRAVALGPAGRPSPPRMSTGAPRAAAQVAGRILVVDDQEPNRLLLRDLLEAQGHVVTEAADGPEALERVREHPPDVVLLDVNMPGLDGFEVCRRLKADPRTAAIPVLLVTALAHREQRLEGIAAGANDYLTKPIDTADLVLRVRNAIGVRRLHVEVETQYQRLQELEQQRDSLVHMLVHDLRSPLTAIRAYLDLIRLDAGDNLSPDLTESINEASKTAARMTEMVSDLIDVSRFEAGALPLTPSEVDLGALIAEALASVGAGAQPVKVAFEPPPQPVRAYCDGDVVRRVIANLVANALKFTPANGSVRVHVEANSAGAKVSVADTGSGIPPEYREKIFEKFGQVEAARQGVTHSSGLGLTFCKLAVEAHGGRIGVESEVGKGSEFWFSLPGEPGARRDSAA